MKSPALVGSPLTTATCDPFGSPTAVPSIHFMPLAWAAGAGAARKGERGRIKSLRITNLPGVPSQAAPYHELRRPPTSSKGRAFQRNLEPTREVSSAKGLQRRYHR